MDCTKYRLECMHDRYCRDNINSTSGREIRDMVDLSEKGWVVSREEAQCFKTNHEVGIDVRFKKCSWYSHRDPDACRNGHNYRFLHLVQERDMTATDAVFRDW